jgi:hypothetical protein
VSGSQGELQVGPAPIAHGDAYGDGEGASSVDRGRDPRGIGSGHWESSGPSR